MGGSKARIKGRQEEDEGAKGSAEGKLGRRREI